MDWKLFFNLIAQYVVARAGERSTYLGLIALAAAAGANLSPEFAQAILSAASAIAGAIMIATADKKAAPASTEMGAGT